MPRPKKTRNICNKPRCMDFKPDLQHEQVTLLPLDEYEVIRLIDYEGLNQEACAVQMGLSRASVQAMYQRARKTIAICLVESTALRIVDHQEPCPKVHKRRHCCKKGGTHHE
ncbi:putative DNA-binding protein (UPF0251 family) [Breznakia blatticola]|uniref:Putative DNA-binding protein (UPF0251 family) n=1 Tax=Breznakia blatticola TaxID=1754012 RepID=A0A4R7ZS60_9FIRM|nr:DUF134 domain-containing protein [Breznakia blatticola]TDW20336.1 putative DNA-binding protein (UPF0251 family) [Breznakia blatticola]